jgi:hypothetical protein
MEVSLVEVSRRERALEKSRIIPIKDSLTGR